MTEALTTDRDRRHRGEAHRLAPPAVRRAIVRTALLDRLAAADVPLVSIVAPAGYGKTTLLAQWVERDPRRSLWLTVDPEEGGDGALVARLAPVAERGELLAVVDDAHLLQSQAVASALRHLLDRAAPGTTLALAGRSAPPLPLPRLRAEGRLLEVGPDDLAFTGHEAQSLLRRAGVLLPERELDDLERRTEGWPAALVLVALSLRDGASVPTMTGDDLFVADYLETEHLARLSAAQRRFAMQTSVLEELTADACDALVGRRDSGRVLGSLERMGVVVPLDHRRSRYRYRVLVRDLLRAELERTDSTRARALHRASADWSEARGDAEAALRHAAAAGDRERVAGIAARLAVPACGGGRLDALEGWLGLLGDHPDVEHHPDLCVVASWLHGVRGRVADAQRWADAAASGLDGEDPRLHVLRALRCRDGVDRMLDEATTACAALRPASRWRPAAVLARGVARLLAGDDALAERDLDEAAESAAAAGAAATAILAFSIRALVAADRDAPTEADLLVAEARAIADAEAPDPSAVQVLLDAVRARSALRRGDRDEAALTAERAERLLPFLTYAVPWLSTLAALELVHVRLALADADGARRLLRRVEEILRVRPRLGAIVQHAAELGRRVHALAEPGGRWASSLTQAETRLLPLLATHLSFREIGERLFVSRNTVKTQAISVYRKFGVSSRSDAIARAVELGLIEETASVPRQKLLSVG